MNTLKDRIKNELSKYDNICGIYADDLKGNKIEINAAKVFETASCIKLFILIELYKQIYEGKKNREDLLKYEKRHDTRGSGIIKSLEMPLEMTAKNVAVLMIALSDNIATNMLIDYLGLDNINNTITQLGLVNTRLWNRIQFDEFNRIGVTTPQEYGTTFEKILKGEVFSLKVCEEILDILKKQQLNILLTKYLPQYDLDKIGEEGSLIKYIASKSGGLGGVNLTPKVDNVRNDGGIIATIYGEYVISIFIRKFKDNNFYQNNINIDCGARISELIFNTYISLEGRFKM